MKSDSSIQQVIRRDDWPKLKSLLTEGLNPNAQITAGSNNFPGSLLQIASSYGAVRIIRGLIECRADLHFAKHHGTPLHCAASFRRVEAVRLLLALGANPNTRGPSLIDGDSNWTALICAAFYGEWDIVERLIESGADTKAQSRAGICAADCAVYHQSIHWTRELMKSGAPATAHGALCAVDRDDPNLLELVLAGSADPNHVAGKVELAVCERGDTLLFFVLRKLGMWRDLVDLRDSLGKEQKHPYHRMINSLLKAGADPNVRIGNRTPVSMAVWSGDVEAVRLLLSAGGDANAQNYSTVSGQPRRGRGVIPSYYNTVLHEAVEKGLLDIAKALLESGADRNRCDHRGQTPIQIAEANGRNELAALLHAR